VITRQSLERSAQHNWNVGLAQDASRRESAVVVAPIGPGVALPHVRSGSPVEPGAEPGGRRPPAAMPPSKLPKVRIDCRSGKAAIPSYRIVHAEIMIGAPKRSS
jgi:hypothetical protein